MVSSIRRFVSAIVLVALTVSGCSHPVEEVRPSQPAAPPARPGYFADAAAYGLPGADDWPWWRGTNRDNHAAGAAPPTTWTESENVLWKVEVPGRGHSSPILWREKLFLTAATDSPETQSLLCYERATGKLLWQTNLHQGGFPEMHKKNSHASATPAALGDHVYTVFVNHDMVWASAVDFDGKIVWQHEAGPFQAPWGYGSSPVVYGSLLIVLSDNRNGGFLAALDRATGSLVWRIQRAKDDSYATPVIATLAGRDQLLVSGQHYVISYDPLTGDERWRCAGPTQATANTVAFGDDVVFAGGGYPERHVMAIKADGSGDVTSSHVLWKKDFKLYVPSPLVVEDRVLAIGDEGVGACFRASDGQELWKQRIAGGFSASPLLVEDLVYVPDERGVMHVFRAGEKKLEKVAQNALGDGGMASAVVAGGRLYLRTLSKLYCIGTEEKSE